MAHMAAGIYTIFVKTIFILAAVICGAIFPASASAGAFSQLAGQAAAAPAVPAPAPAMRAAPKEWTVLIYVSARNNLGIEALKDVNEMEAAGSTDKVNVVAELGRIKCEPDFNPFSSVQPPVMAQADWTGSRRFLLVKDADPLSITSPVLSYSADADMGDWKRLADFIAWGKAAYPAKHYMLVVGGHGSGWRGVKPPAGVQKGISYDEVSGNHISPAELAQAIQQNGGVDVYASDACLMQTAEVLYELRGAAGLVVGSQETTPGSGWNYEVFLKALSASPGGAMEAAQAVMKGYSEYYGGQGQSVTMSIARPAEAAALAVKMDKFAGLVAASPADIRLYIDKRFGLRSFDDEDARDLAQLMKLYYDDSPTPAVKAAAKDVMDLLAGKVIVRNDAVGYKSKDANGVSVFMPFYRTGYQDKYAYLSFAQATRWDDMLRAIAAAWK